MTPAAQADGRTARGWAPAAITPVRVAAFLAVLALAFFVGRGCQEAQVRISKDRAIETARAEVSFQPTLVNVRLLRQGINGQPFWFVNLQRRAPSSKAIQRLVVVQIDANTGKVTDVDRQR
jgi:hypothetical protein